MRQSFVRIIRYQQWINFWPNLEKQVFFLKRDIKNAFHQVELSEECRYITTFLTSTGLHQYKRLMLGISCAPECFQKILERILLPCEGVTNFIDDIIVFGSNLDEHMRLRKLLVVLEENNILLNKAKCIYGVTQVQFLGHELSSKGIKSMDKYTTAIASFRSPSTIEELQSFIGLATYLGKWIPNFSILTYPLRQLLKLKVGRSASIKQHWTTDKQQAFQQPKDELTNIRTLGYYNPEDKTQVIADASQVGLGAFLIQIDNNGPRAIAYGSKSLTDCEKRYCQTEKEALALVWAVEHFDIYLRGKDSFDLISDHKPLQVIFRPKSKPCARIERWVLRLQSYNFKIK
uniref:Reverse transcriptase domain-containing protein n=1 Tax=Trichogramma kaykai TaxID=54128 RepID=A0ABD2X2W1_9HYME